MHSSLYNPQTNEMPLRQMKLYELGCRLGYQDPRSLPSPGGRSDKTATGTHTAGTGTTSNTQTPQTPQPADTQTLNILQLNISSLQNKKMELAKMLSDMRIHVALLQETQLPKRIECHLTGYTMYQMHQMSRYCNPHSK